jgi:hypothetical protein
MAFDLEEIAIKITAGAHATSSIKRDGMAKPLKVPSDI